MKRTKEQIKWDSTALALILVQCFSVTTPVVNVGDPRHQEALRELANQRDTSFTWQAAPLFNAPLISLFATHNLQFKLNFFHKKQTF